MLISIIIVSIHCTMVVGNIIIIIIPNIIRWGEEQKPFASMVVGTSPEFELALYTTCLLARSMLMMMITMMTMTMMMTMMTIIIFMYSYDGNHNDNDNDRQ